MKIIKQSGQYSLIKRDELNSSLNYYIDNGQDVSEYFDKLEAQELNKLTNVAFEICAAMYF